MPQLKHLPFSLAVLAMASAQSTSLPTNINVDSTSSLQTSYTLTGTSIALATGSPPPVASTTIHVDSTVIPQVPAASSTSSSQIHLPIPAIVGIAAGGAVLLIAIALLTTYICIRRRRIRSQTTQWPDLPTDTLYRSTSQAVPLRRPSSSATLVDAPVQGYIHSKGSLECASTPLTATLHYSKSTKSFKSTHSTSLERVSEEATAPFKFDFGIPPRVEVTPPFEPVAAPQVNDQAFQKLVLDKSLPSSPECEVPIPMTVSDMMAYQAGKGTGRPVSSVYSSPTGQVLRETWSPALGGGGDANVRGSYF